MNYLKGIVELFTTKNKENFKKGALSEILLFKQNFKTSTTHLVIADIGANIGYFSESFLHHYPNSTVHGYDPHPIHIQELLKINDARFVLHPYGLFNSNGKFTIGMKNDGRANNGTFGIFDNLDSVEVDFKNADEEQIRPHIVKLDVEGSESYILECANFFSETQAILVELIHQDNFGLNSKVIENLKKLGFKYSLRVGRNDQVWVKNVE